MIYNIYVIISFYFRLIWCTTYAVLVYYTPSLIRKNGLVSVPTHYYFIMGLVIITNEVSLCMWLMAIIYLDIH